jgi:hypothetical protein
MTSIQLTGDPSAVDYWCVPCKTRGRRVRGVRRHHVRDQTVAARFSDHLGISIEPASAVTLCGAHLKFVADFVDRSDAPQSSTDQLGYTMPCPKCAQQAAPKRSRAQARRTLTRHLVAAHGHGHLRAQALAERLLRRYRYVGSDPLWAARDRRHHARQLATS